MCGFGEFTFTISDTFGRKLLSSNMLVVFALCSISIIYLTLMFVCIVGDGICCSVGSGSYKITYNGAEVAADGDFGSLETKTFGSCGGTNPVSTRHDT